MVNGDADTLARSALSLTSISACQLPAGPGADGEGDAVAGAAGDGAMVVLAGRGWLLAVGLGRRLELEVRVTVAGCLLADGVGLALGLRLLLAAGPTLGLRNPDQADNGGYSHPLPK